MKFLRILQIKWIIEIVVDEVEIFVEKNFVDDVKNHIDINEKK